METFYQIYFWDIAVLLQYVIQTCIATVGSGLMVDGPYLDFDSGYKSIEFSRTFDDGSIQHVTCIYLMLGETQTMPARALFKTLSFDQTNGWTVFLGGGGLQTFAQLRDLWEDYCVAFTAQVLDSWCECFTGTPVVWDITAAGDAIYALTAIIPVTTDADVFPVTLSAYGLNGDSGGVTQRVFYQPMGVMGPVNVRSDSSNEGIVSALKEIAMSRTEISINNGDAMFSVTGGSRAASEA